MECLAGGDRDVGAEAEDNLQERGPYTEVGGGGLDVGTAPVVFNVLTGVCFRGERRQVQRFIGLSGRGDDGAETDWATWGTGARGSEEVGWFFFLHRVALVGKCFTVTFTAFWPVSHEIEAR